MIEALLADLRDEGDLVESWVVGADLSAPTPASGWTVAHQVAHLAWTDEQALLAVRDPEGFGAAVAAAFSANPDPARYVSDAAEAGARRGDLLDHWRATRIGLADALGAVPPKVKVPWFGPPMSPASMATARLMETWAHGGDIADGLGVVREPTARIKHVAHLGVRTRDFAYLVRGKTVPVEEFRVELTGPGGESWCWGPEDARQRVAGSAWDFCRLVVQRVHRDDTDLVAEGDDAREWLGIAQAFAGPPGEGRAKA